MKKQLKNVVYTSLSPYDLANKFHEICDLLAKYEREIRSQHPEATNIRLDWEPDNYSYGGDRSSQFDIIYNRMETDEEYETRIKVEEKHAEEKKRSDLAMLRQLKEQYPDFEKKA